MDLQVLQQLIAKLTILIATLSSLIGSPQGLLKLQQKPFDGRLGAITTSGNFPTSLSNFQDGDVINSGDWGNLESWMGITTATTSASLRGLISIVSSTLSSSTDPGHKHTSDAVSGTIAVAKGGTGANTFTEGLIIASGTNAFSSLITNGNGSIPIASGTTWIAGNITSGNNVTISTSSGAITISAASKFGGDGTDGALNITTGTQSLSLGGQTSIVKNYSSITISGTSTLAFTATSTNGTVIILKSQGVCNLSSASSTMIDLRSLGAMGGAGGAQQGTQGGSGGGGGGSALAEGSGGLNPSSSGGQGIGAAGTTSNWIGRATGGGAGQLATGGTAGGSPFFLASSTLYTKALVIPGSGGGGGAGGPASGTGGAGGSGAGALYLECAGALNFTGTIIGTGTVGSNGATNGGGGGGGGGGSVVILYTSASSTAGVFTMTGGAGGTGFASGGAGANGYGVVAKNTEF